MASTFIVALILSTCPAGSVAAISYDAPAYVYTPNLPAGYGALLTDGVLTLLPPPGIYGTDGQTVTVCYTEDIYAFAELHGVGHDTTTTTTSTTRPPPRQDPPPPRPPRVSPGEEGAIEDGMPTVRRTPTIHSGPHHPSRTWWHQRHIKLATPV